MTLLVAVNIALAIYALYIGNYFWAALCVVLAFMCSDHYKPMR